MTETRISPCPVRRVHGPSGRGAAGGWMGATAALGLLVLSCGPGTQTPQQGSGGASAGGGGTTGGSGGRAGGNGDGAASGGSTATGSGGRPATGGSGAGASMAASGGEPGTGGVNAATGGMPGSTGGASADGGRPATGGAGGPTGGAGGNGGSRTGGAGGAGGAQATACDWANAAGRIALFDGSGLSAWQNANTGGQAQWRLIGDGSMEVVPMNPSANILTSMKFESLCLHIEYMTPSYPANVTGQARGNSGIYFKRSYEMQVLDSYGQPPLLDGCGAVYEISAPLVVACNMELVWNTYEIEFRGSEWDAAGKKIKNAAFVMATLNGKVVQRNVDLRVSMTTAGQADAAGPQALMLQDHGNAVRYRNIWAKVPRY